MAVKNLNAEAEMCEKRSEPNIGHKLRKQLARIEQLCERPFDDPKYEKWRLETGQILDQLFGQVQAEQHPCTKAFLNYRIPENFTATPREMQEYYRNILSYQADLLKIYLEDIEN
jgi:hypothetical protein